MMTARLDKSQIYKGVYITKEAPVDVKVGEAAAETLLKELAGVTSAIEKNKKDTDDKYTILHNGFDKLKADSEEIKGQVKKHVDDYAALVKEGQTLKATLDQVKRELDAPIVKGGKDLEESDRQAAVELQRRAYLFKGGDPDTFNPNMDNLVIPKHYRSAVQKLMKVGIETPEKIRKTFTVEETKAFEASSLDAAMFSPELLGITVDCIITCAEMTDLYSQVSVSKSQFMYPQIKDYGAIGKYDCDAKCDAEYGPEGNIQYKNGQVYDWRGVFCFNRKVLTEANYDLLGFMYRSAQRAHQIAYNQALITGGAGGAINEPKGWLTENCFTPRKTRSAAVTHIEWRTFLSSIPVEYGPVTAIMHQNAFAYLAALTDSIGQFVFGDGLMSFTPDDVREKIRISNCLHDPTHNLTLGTPDDPFVTGEFFAAIGAWKMAYYAVSKRPLWIEQWLGKSTAWCVSYSLGAEDGGFVGCCPAASILSVGP